MYELLPFEGLEQGKENVTSEEGSLKNPSSHLSLLFFAFVHLFSMNVIPGNFIDIKT